MSITDSVPKFIWIQGEPVSGSVFRCHKYGSFSNNTFQSSELAPINYPRLPRRKERNASLKGAVDHPLNLIGRNRFKAEGSGGDLLRESKRYIDGWGLADIFNHQGNDCGSFEIVLGVDYYIRLSLASIGNEAD